MASAYSLAAWVAAHDALLTVISTGTGTDQAAVFVDSSDTVLATVPLDLATSDVGVDGTLTLEIDGSPPNATATGTADRVIVQDKDGDPVLELDCKVGTVAEAGYMVMNTLSIVSGMPVDITSFTIPAGTTIS
jgi:hypothetical protein